MQTTYKGFVIKVTASPTSSGWTAVALVSGVSDVVAFEFVSRKETEMGAKAAAMAGAKAAIDAGGVLEDGVPEGV